MLTRPNPFLQRRSGGGLADGAHSNPRRRYFNAQDLSETRALYSRTRTESLLLSHRRNNDRSVGGDPSAEPQMTDARWPAKSPAGLLGGRAGQRAFPTFNFHEFPRGRLLSGVHRVSAATRAQTIEFPQSVAIGEPDVVTTAPAQML